MRKLRLRLHEAICSGYTAAKWSLLHPRLPLCAGDCGDGCRGRAHIGEHNLVPSIYPPSLPDSPSCLPDPGTGGLGLLFLFLPLCFQEVTEGSAFQELRTAQVGVVGESLHSYEICPRAAGLFLKSPTRRKVGPRLGHILFPQEGTRPPVQNSLPPKGKFRGKECVCVCVCVCVCACVYNTLIKHLL